MAGSRGDGLHRDLRFLQFRAFPLALDLARQVLAGRRPRRDHSLPSARLRAPGTAGLGGIAGVGTAFVFGVLLAVLIGAVTIGGIKSTGAVTSRLVPALGTVYVLACLTAIAVNIGSVPSAVADIVTVAFTPAAGFGGAIGVLIVGFQRAAFSNEAGLGSAPIAHSAARTRYPATEGLVAPLEPFVDTVITRTMPALTTVIAGTGLWVDAQQAVLKGGDTPDGVVTSESFTTVLPWFPYVLTLAVALFSISTITTWGCCGQRARVYLFGGSRTEATACDIVFGAFTVVGCVLALGSVLDFADAVLFALALFNIIGPYVLLPVVERELKLFREKLHTGEVERVGCPGARRFNPGEPPARRCPPLGWHRSPRSPSATIG